LYLTETLTYVTEYVHLMNTFNEPPWSSYAEDWMTFWRLAPLSSREIRIKRVSLHIFPFPDGLRTLKTKIVRLDMPYEPLAFERAD
jgi:hypothetical protein